MTFRSSVLPVDDLRGPAGQLEAILNTGLPDARFAALVAHPHPPSGGTMHTKAVYHAAKAFSSCGLPVLRFNFRGTGRSEGLHDNGPGEIDDVRAAIDYLDRRFHLPILCAGFSFGANVGLRASCGDARVHGLIGLGLPVLHAGRSYSYEFLPTCGTVPKLILCGDHDPYAPKLELERAIALAPDPKTVLWIEGADHFFAGIPQSPASKLDAMRAAMTSWLGTTFALDPA